MLFLNFGLIFLIFCYFLFYILLLNVISYSFVDPRVLLIKFIVLDTFISL